MKANYSSLALMFMSMALTLHLTDQAVRHSQERVPSGSALISERCSDFSVVASLPEAGLGALVECEPGGIRLVTCLPGHAAALSGLRVGDRIVAINGQSTSGCNAPWAVSQLRGKIGTTVTLDVERGEGIWQRTFRAQVERRHIETQHSVYSRVREGELTIKVLWLGPETPAQLAEHLAQVTDQEVDNLVLDLSNLNSGDIQSLKESASLFLPTGTTVGYYGHTGVEGEQQKAELVTSGYQFTDKLTEVRVGRYTAKTGEMLARALAANLDVEVTGEKTAGLGSLDGRTIRSREHADAASFELYDSHGKLIDGNPLTPGFWTWSNLLSPVGAGLE